MTDRATRYLDGLLRAVPGFEEVYFGGPPQEGARNPCIVYSITGDERYPTLRNPDRVIAVDFRIAVRSNDAAEVEQLGQTVWNAVSVNRKRVREIGEYVVTKMAATDGSDITETVFYAIKDYRVRVK